MDGVDLLPFVSGSAPGNPHKSLFWRSGPYKTLLEGDWKLQVSHIPNKMWLFDLKNDPTERQNLAATEPVRLRDMLAKMNENDKAQHKPLWPSLIEGAIDIDHPLSYPQHPNDEYVYWSN